MSDSPLPIPISPLTLTFGGVVREIIMDIHVSGFIAQHASPHIPFDPNKQSPYKGLWDTGATATVITQKIVDELGLKPISMTKVSTASHSDIDAEVYLVSLFLPNKVALPNLRVTKGSPAGCDMLIGMDVITTGDFAITHKGGKTTFSFRIPSVAEIDFVKEAKERRAITALPHAPSRNSPCTCGSGKKYKKCCGKNV